MRHSFQKRHVQRVRAERLEKKVFDKRLELGEGSGIGQGEAV